MQFVRIIVIVLSLGIGSAYGSGYQYEKREQNNHVIHIVTINSKDYKTDIVKANEGALGREKVSSIAKRSKAAIAINGGFFEIGADKDGMPSGTLVIDGHQYNSIDKIQPLMVIDRDKIFIAEANPKNYIAKTVSMISGIPLLISDGKIAQDLIEKDGGFYSKPHARTALGIKADGTIIILVAEHKYLRDLTAVTMGEIQSLMKEKGKTFAEQYNHQTPGDITVNELKEILRKEYTSEDGTQGLTIIALAEIMKELGCREALNLDGGGSSTLWIDGKIVNQTIGDKDEENGQQTLRPISDAIIFTRR